MTDEKRELIDQSAHRLRNRLMFIMLCSDTLKLDLQDVLTREHERVFQRMDRILEETKAVLNTLLQQFELEPRAIEAPNGCGSQLIGGLVQPDNAACASEPGAL
jgi:signal transduction histidine kinase